MFGLTWLFCALSFTSSLVIEDDDARRDPPEDKELLERASRADPIALTALYDQYVERIYSYTYHRVGQTQVAEDLTAQVFVRMLEAVRGGHGWRTSFSGWLYRIAHNQVIDYYRRRQRASFVELDEAPPTPTVYGDPFRSVQSNLEGERLRSALRRLTEEQQQVVTLRFLEDLSIAEVAEIMRKTEGAIKALQYRAVLALRRFIQP